MSILPVHHNQSGTHILKDVALWDLQQAINEACRVSVLLPLREVINLW